MIVPDPRWENPSLLIPGQKPVGAISVDWANFYGEKLITLFLPGNDASSAPPKYQTVNAPIAPVDGELSARFGGTGAVAVTPSNGIRGFPFSLLLRVRQNSAPSSFNLYFWSHATSAAAYYAGFQVSVSPTRVIELQAGLAVGTAAGARSTWTTNYIIPIGEYVNMLAVFRSGTDRSLYILGETITGTYSGSGFLETPSNRTINIARWAAGLNRDTDCDIPLCAGFNYGFSEAQANALLRDPYQFLLPA